MADRKRRNQSLEAEAPFTFPMEEEIVTAPPLPERIEDIDPGFGTAEPVLSSEDPVTKIFGDPLFDESRDAANRFAAEITRVKERQARDLALFDASFGTGGPRVPIRERSLFETTEPFRTGARFLREITPKVHVGATETELREAGIDPSELLEKTRPGVKSVLGTLLLSGALPFIAGASFAPLGIAALGGLFLQLGLGERRGAAAKAEAAVQPRRESLVRLKELAATKGIELSFKPQFDVLEVTKAGLTKAAELPALKEFEKFSASLQKEIDKAKSVGDEAKAQRLQQINLGADLVKQELGAQLEERTQIAINEAKSKLEGQLKNKQILAQLRAKFQAITEDDLQLADLLSKIDARLRGGTTEQNILSVTSMMLLAGQTSDADLSDAATLEAMTALSPEVDESLAELRTFVLELISKVKEKRDLRLEGKKPETETKPKLGMRRLPPKMRRGEGLLR